MYHNYSKDMMIGLAIAFAILPFAFVCLRLWAKRISKRLGWDDILTVAALVRNMHGEPEHKARTAKAD